eukprot:tig00020592_g11652.t1
MAASATARDRIMRWKKKLGISNLSLRDEDIDEIAADEEIARVSPTSSSDASPDVSLSSDEPAMEAHGSKSRARRSGEGVTAQLTKTMRHYDQLQLDMARKDVMLQTLRVEHDRVVQTYEMRLREERQKRIEVEARLTDEAKTAQAELRTLQDRSGTEIRALKERLARLDVEVPELREKLAADKELLRDLFISEELYAELRRKAEQDQSLAEFVQVRAFELLRPIREDRERLRREIAAVRESAQAAVEEAAKAAREAAQRERLLRDERDGLKTALEATEERARRVDGELREALARAAASADKARAYDEAAGRAERAEKELRGAAHAAAMAEAQAKAATAEREEMARRLAERSQASELLTLDKSYLSKEVDALQERLRAAEEAAEKLKGKNTQLKQQKQEAVDRLIAWQQESRASSQATLQAELQRLQERAQADMDELRRAARDLHERESRALREARDTAVQDAERLRARLEDAKDANERLQTQHRELQNVLEAQIGDARMAAKTKVFELERLSARHDETAASLAQATGEIDALRKKLDVARTEYYALQAEAGRRAAELEGQVRSQAEKLAQYESLERELEAALVDAAALAEPAPGPEGQHSLRLIDALAAGSPAAPRRHLKQSLLLARKALALERENVQLIKSLEAEKEKVQQLSDEIGRLQKRVEQVGQPYNYLVESIQQRDRELAASQLLVSTLQADLKRAQEERGRAEAERRGAVEDLRRLLERRESIDHLRAVAARIQSDAARDAGAAAAAVPPLSPSRRAPEDDGSQPAPILLGSRPRQVAGGPGPAGEAPEWYRKLVEKRSASAGAGPQRQQRRATARRSRSGRGLESGGEDFDEAEGWFAGPLSPSARAAAP